jgi:ATP-dependent DNA ligase
VLSQEIGGKPISKTLTNINQAIVKPMLASQLPEDASIDDYSANDFVLEEKYDGHRIIVHVGPDGIKAWSRVGNERTLPPYIVKEIQDAWGWGVYDSEEYIPGDTSTSVTDILKMDLHHLAIFDILKIGKGLDDCMALDVSGRRQILQAMTKTHLLPVDARVQMAPQYDPSAEALKTIWDRGGEGAILKLRSGLYVPGRRSRDWIKFKKGESFEMTIIDFESGLLGPFSKVVLRHDDGTVTSVKSLNDAWRAAFAANPDRFLGEKMIINTFGRTPDSFKSPMADHIVGIEL